MVYYLNPRSLAGATRRSLRCQQSVRISIHAPSRERRCPCNNLQEQYNFNPRSLAGATLHIATHEAFHVISIHAPSRERLCNYMMPTDENEISIHAPSRERHLGFEMSLSLYGISIHAPLRERRLFPSFLILSMRFQSTLPCGSDGNGGYVLQIDIISIHAPSRERLITSRIRKDKKYFNPRSLTGATTRP